MMEEPTYKKLVAMLAASVTGNDGRYNHVIKAMREQVDPAIARMTKPQLVKAFSEAVLGIHNRDVDLRSYDGIDGIIETKHKECLIERLTVGHLVNELKDMPSKAGRKGANALHDKPGGSRDLAGQILKIWATGKYSSRDICAEEEYAGLGDWSRKTARNALIGSPDPDPWPANPKKKK